MRCPDISYIGDARLRQPPPLARSPAIAVLGAALCGCASLGLPFGETGVDNGTTTGSFERVSSKGGGKVAQSDWEAIRQSIARAEAQGTLSQALAWRNPWTGTTGTLTVLDTVTATNDPNCRNFQNTINDGRGIRHCRGEACRMSKERCKLFGVLADDSKLL